MKLDDRKWKEFYIKDVFNVENKTKIQIPTGAYVHKNMLNKGNTPRITVTSQNNGIDGYYDSQDKNYRICKNFISVSFLGTVFYHKYKASIDMKVHCLQIKNKDLNLYVSVFLITEVKKSIENASYGNQISSTDLPNKKLILPINSKNQPDWQFMEDYTKSIFDKKQQDYKSYVEKSLTKLTNSIVAPCGGGGKWKEFYISGKNGIFKISSSASGIDKNKLKFSLNDLNTPYITRTEESNGINKFINKEQSEKYSLDDKCVITIGLDTQTVFFQQHEFYTGQNIQILKYKNINKYNALFIIPLLKIQMQKFNWGGNGATLGRLAKTKIMLPTTKKGNPDYLYMEQYAKNIMCKKYNNYLEYIN
jgi:hypothetical protein